MTGIPYAKAAHDTEGNYAVICPLCHIWFKGRGSTEDEITKSAAQVYALHYAVHHVPLGEPSS